MKKLIAILLTLTMVMALAACGASPEAPATTPSAPATEAPTEKPTEAPTEAPATSAVMTHAEYEAAALDDAVCVETYVQAHQSWWDNKITVYAQSEDGAYFLYEMACSKEDAEKLVPGTKIRVNGFKTEWAGEVEIKDATFEIIEGSYVAEPVDLTDLLGTDELIAHQNELATFKGLTVASVSFKNDEPGDDIYVSFTKDDVTCDFCVEYYLTGTETEVYEAVSALNVGDVVDVEGFLYWYNGANTHITSVNVVSAGAVVMTHAEYEAAALDDAVCVETYVQAHQSWWNDKITVYAQSEDGAYFLYEMACSQEDSEKLVPGTKIRVNGFKAEWAGEIEIKDATFEIIEGSYIAEPVDLTDLLGSDELLAHQNELAVFKGLTVASVSFKNGEPGDDIYVSFTKDDVTCDFCVEYYLTGTDTEVYAAVSALSEGDVVDVTGFLYWYNGANTHIINVTAAE